MPLSNFLPVEVGPIGAEIFNIDVTSQQSGLLEDAEMTLADGQEELLVWNMSSSDAVATFLRASYYMLWHPQF